MWDVSRPARVETREERVKNHQKPEEALKEYTRLMRREYRARTLEKNTCRGYYEAKSNK